MFGMITDFRFSFVSLSSEIYIYIEQRAGRQSVREIVTELNGTTLARQY